MNEIFNRLIKESLTPNSLYVLHCIQNKISVNKLVSASLEVQKLKANDWIKNDLELTGKSIILLEELNSFFRKSKKKTSKDLLGDNFTLRIKMYNEVFPAKKLGSGKYARTNVKNLETAFRWFFENYDYSWDTIMSATKLYVEEYQLKNYEYMRTSQYFIRKQNNSDKTFESDLANFCEQYLNGEDTVEEIFREKIV
tara:strand:- start:254 stop:844 length:591 start_codon:yes stop_codon:yes gene_type:complete